MSSIFYFMSNKNAPASTGAFVHSVSRVTEFIHLPERSLGRQRKTLQKSSRQMQT